MSYYSQFMRLKRELMDIVGLPFVLEEVLLTIDDYTRSGVMMKCGDLLEMKWLGSPATVHSRYKRLLKLGYIEYREHGDGRVKDIVVSQKGRRYFREVEVLLESCKNQGQRERKLNK